MSLVKGKIIIFENNIMKFLPKEIKNDNYAIFCILDHIAIHSEINIGTTGYVRLGEKYDFRLSEFN